MGMARQPTVQNMLCCIATGAFDQVLKHLINDDVLQTMHHAVSLVPNGGCQSVSSPSYPMSQ